MPWGILAGQLCERNCQLQITCNEAVIEVSKAQKGLYSLHFLWPWPIPDDLDFCLVHLQAVRADNEA